MPSLLVYFRELYKKNCARELYFSLYTGYIDIVALSVAARFLYLGWCVCVCVCPDSGGEEGVMKRKRRRGLLRMYYGVDEGSTQQASDPLDIDKTGFQSQQFMDKLLKESSLNQLYVQEDKMKKGRWGGAEGRGKAGAEGKGRWG